jgi:hypothetical protein
MRDASQTLVVAGLAATVGYLLLVMPPQRERTVVRTPPPPCQPVSARPHC